MVLFTNAYEPCPRIMSRGKRAEDRTKQTTSNKWIHGWPLTLSDSTGHRNRWRGVTRCVWIRFCFALIRLPWFFGQQNICVRTFIYLHALVENFQVVLVIGILFAKLFVILLSLEHFGCCLWWYFMLRFDFRLLSLLVILG